MAFTNQSRLRDIAVKHVDPANFTDKPSDKTDSAAGHPPMPGMPTTHYKDLGPTAKPSPLPVTPPIPFKMK
jgi:hypothetical protein